VHTALPHRPGGDHAPPRAVPLHPDHHVDGDRAPATSAMQASDSTSAPGLPPLDSLLADVLDSALPR
jgi:hypothetical protein